MKKLSEAVKIFKVELRLLYHAGDNSDKEGVKMDIIDESQDGQLEVYFCSTDCKRQFLNELVDNIKELLLLKKY